MHEYNFILRWFLARSTYMNVHVSLWSNLQLSRMLCKSSMISISFALQPIAENLISDLVIWYLDSFKSINHDIGKFQSIALGIQITDRLVHPFSKMAFKQIKIYPAYKLWHRSFHAAYFPLRNCFTYVLIIHFNSSWFFLFGQLHAMVFGHRLPITNV